MERILVLLLVVGATALLAAWWRARDGRVVSLVDATDAPGDTSPARGAAPAAHADPADQRWSALPTEAADIVAAVAPTTPLTLVEFTAPDCQPCRATHSLLREAAAERDEVGVVTVDVADALDLARAHRIMRAPTTLLVTHQGHLLGRVSGVPRRAELDALLDQSARGVLTG